MTNNHDGAKPRRPGDLIIDRYLPNATDEEREEARENLRNYALVLIRIGERIAQESSEFAPKEFEDIRPFRQLTLF